MKILNDRKGLLAALDSSVIWGLRTNRETIQLDTKFLAHTFNYSNRAGLQGHLIRDFKNAGYDVRPNNRSHIVEVYLK